MDDTDPRLVTLEAMLGTDQRWEVLRYELVEGEKDEDPRCLVWAPPLDDGWQWVCNRQDQHTGRHFTPCYGWWA